MPSMLLGMEMEDAKHILDVNEIEYEVNKIQGRKDAAILTEPRIIRVLESRCGKLELTITHFSSPL